MTKNQRQSNITTPFLTLLHFTSSRKTILSILCIPIFSYIIHRVLSRIHPQSFLEDDLPNLLSTNPASTQIPRTSSYLSTHNKEGVMINNENLSPTLASPPINFQLTLAPRITPTQPITIPPPSDTPKPTDQFSLLSNNQPPASPPISTPRAFPSQVRLRTSPSSTEIMKELEDCLFDSTDWLVLQNCYHKC